LSLYAPTRKIEYSATGTSWTDISDDVLEFDVWLRDLAAGMSEFTVTLDNKDGKYSKSGGIFPAFGTEAGFHYYKRIAVNNAYLIAGRIAYLEPFLQDKDLCKIQGRCLGHELTRLLIQDQWRDQKADDVIDDALAKAIKGGTVDVTYASPSSAPKVSIDAMQNPRYLNDLIREICELTDYAAFVKTQAALTQGTLLFFPKNDASKRHSTVLKNVLYASDNNVVTFRLPRSIDESKNWCFFGGRMSHYEPPDMDKWTESTKGWYSKNGITNILLSNRVAPILGIGGENTSKFSILGTTYSKEGPWLRFSIVDLLGENFSCTTRSADNLHFWYAVHPGIEKTGLYAVSPKIFLQDADGNRIYRFMDLIGGIDADWWSGWIWWALYGGWREYTAPIGWSMGIYDALNPDPEMARDWYFDTGFHSFNWDQIRFIEFQDWNSKPSQQQNFLWIDGLCFHQSYTPSCVAKNLESIERYGARMERPTTVDFVSYGDLKAWADPVIAAMSKPTLLLDVVAKLDPASEVLYPAYSISVNIPRLGITPGSPYFRILEIHYHWSNQGFDTELSLIPSTVA